MIDVIAHRGASAYAPENTLASFSKAIELKADWLELDVQLTKDGQVVVIHDGDLERVAGIKKRVDEMTLEEIRRVDVGSRFSKEFAGERIPTLDAVLSLAKNRVGVYIELKVAKHDKVLNRRIGEVVSNHRDSRSALLHKLMEEIEAFRWRERRFRRWPAVQKLMEKIVEPSRMAPLELTRKVIALVRAKHMKDHVVFQSFSPVCTIVTLAEAPEIRTEFLSFIEKDDPERWPRSVAFVNAVGVAGVNVNMETATPERVAAFHQAGMTCAVWTVDDPAIVQCCVERGVNRIISNKPDVVLATLRELGKR
jgi:glycerophosphoryl diester phosphodiesterase